MSETPAGLERYDDDIFALQYERAEGRDSNHDDIEYYVAALADAGGPVLELGCGTGRVTIPVAKSGVDITGLDSARAMLRIARRKAEAAGVRVPFVLANAVTYRSDGPFAAVTFPYNSLCFVPEDRLGTFERNLRNLVRPGGRFLFDLARPSPERFDADGRRTVPLSDPIEMPELGLTLERRITLIRHPSGRGVDTVYDWEITHADGRRETRRSVLPFTELAPEEHVARLERQGFVLCEFVERAFERGGIERCHCFVALTRGPEGTPRA